MSAQLHSELLKLRTTSTVLFVLLAALGLSAIGVAIEGLASSLAELAQEDLQRRLLGGGSVVVFFATVAGALIVTGEFRYGTIRPTLLFEPRRRVVLATKLAAAALVGVVFAVVCLAVSLGAGFAILAARDVDTAVGSADTVALALGTVAVSALGAMIGVAIGALVRNQVGAIIALVAYAFVIDAGLFAAVPSLGRFLPGKAGDALAGQLVDDLLAPGPAAAILLLWTVALVGVAVVRTDHRDV